MNGRVEKTFFYPGGTLPLDAPSYVKRRADDELLGCLEQRQYCSILTSRQVGKSSLIARTAVSLRSASIEVSFIDLNRIGATEQTRETWYYSLLLSGGKSLGLSKKEIDEFWKSSTWPTPMQKWLAGIEELFLARGSSDLVMFIDEIDDVRNAEFKDEFFAAIRSCYNRRATEPVFERLTFCLVGSAMPSDLIADPELTPFNVGRNIELTDFTVDEAQGLAPGLGRSEAAGRALIERICYWTGGHPYLTHRLCVAVAESPSVATNADVDQLVGQIFFSTAHAEPDMNLTFVRDRILRTMRGEGELATLLALYENVRAGKHVPDRKADPFSDVLRLSGVVRSNNGLLAVRNRIYSRVFNREWVRESVPDAELRRQRAAFLRGALRAASLLTAVFALVIGFAVYAAVQRNRAKHLEYLANMAGMGQLWSNTNIDVMEELLWKADPRERKNFEWRFWMAQLHQDSGSLGGAQDNKVAAVVFSPKGDWIVTAGQYPHIDVWDVKTRHLRFSLKTDWEYTLSLAVSPDGQTLLAGGLESHSHDNTFGIVARWNLWTRTQVGASIRVRESAPASANTPFNGQINCVRISQDGKYLAAAVSDGQVWLYDVLKNRTTWLVHSAVPRSDQEDPDQEDPNIVFSVAFHPFLPIVASGGVNGHIKLWNRETKQQIGSDLVIPYSSADQNRESVDTLAFSPNGRILASGSKDKKIRLRRINLRNPSHVGPPVVLTDSQDWVSSIVFTSDGRHLLSGGRDRRIRCWDVATREQMWSIAAHGKWVNCIAIDEAHGLLASASDDRRVKFWKLPNSTNLAPLQSGPSPDETHPMPKGNQPANLFAACRIASGKFVIAGKAGGFWVFDVATSSFSPIPRIKLLDVRAIAVTHDGSEVLAMNTSGEFVKFNVHTGDATTSRVPIGGKLEPNGIAISPDLNLASLSYIRGNVTVEQLSPLGGGGGGTAGEERALFRRPVNNVAPFTTALFSGSRFRLAWAEPGVLRVASDPADVQQAPLTEFQNGRVIFSPRGDELLTFSSKDSDPEFFLFDAENLQKAPLIFIGHLQGVASAAFNADETRIVTCGTDATIKLWDVETQRELLSLEFRAGGDVQASFTGDDRTIVGISKLGQVSTWTGATDADIARWEKQWRALLPHQGGKSG